MSLHSQLHHTKSKLQFSLFAIPVLFLFFVILTMTLFEMRWWSLIWAAEALALLLLGLVRDIKSIRYGGIALIVISLLKLGIWDMRQLEDDTRVLVLVGIGLLFVVASYFYARFKNRIIQMGSSLGYHESEKEGASESE